MSPPPLLDAAFAVERRSFAVHAELGLDVGELLSLFGPSGSGKTTILEALAGSAELASGEVRLAGRVVNTVSARSARRTRRAGSARRAPSPRRAPRDRAVEPRERAVALVRQPTSLFPHMTVGANVSYHLGRTASAHVEALLDEVGLSGLAGAMPDSLSGGQRQRACLARAIARPFRALLLDEPFSAVDAPSKAALRALASTSAIRAGGVAILVTHDLGEAQAFGHRLGVMDEGELLQVGPSGEIVRRPATRRVAELLGYPSFVPGEAGKLWALHPEGFADGAFPDRGVVVAGRVLSLEPFGPRYACTLEVENGRELVRAHLTSPRKIGDRLELTAIDPPLVTGKAGGE